ncbi:MAG: hypothetical protein VW405_00290, partial [Rhodospirillaceae bacterium]
LVVSLNLRRRHLTASQFGMCAAKADVLWARMEAEAVERHRVGSSRGGKGVVTRPHPSAHPAPKSRDKIAAAFGISGSTVQRAKKVHEKGSAKLKAAVEKGEMTVGRASQIADLPKKEQDAALVKPPPRFELAMRVEGQEAVKGWASRLLLGAARRRQTIFESTWSSEDRDFLILQFETVVAEATHFIKHLRRQE